MSLQAFQTLFYELATAPEDSLSSITLSEVPAVSGLFSALPNHQFQQYRWMVYANHAETLETIYPLTYALLEDTWQPLVEEYLATYPPKHYQLYETAKAFPKFIGKQEEYLSKYPFIQSLATYELLEATILRMPEEKNSRSLSFEVITSSRLDQFSPAIQKASAPFVSDYPLNKIVELLKQQSVRCDELLSIESTPFFMWAYRDSEFQCRFLKVTPFVSSCLESFFKTSALSYEEHLVMVLKSLNVEVSEEIREDYCQLIQNLLSLGVLKGSKTYPDS